MCRLISVRTIFAQLLPAALLALPGAAFAQIGQTATQGEPALQSAPSAPAAQPAASEPEPEAAATAAPSGHGDYVVDAAPTPIGATGLLRTYQATGLPTGTFGLNLQLEYFSGSDVVRAGDEARRFLGHLGLSYTPIEYVEAFIAVHSRAVTNSLGDPELIQSVGDLNFGAKGMYAVTEWLSLGLLLNVNMPAGANQVGLDLGSTGVDIIAIGSFDLREVADVPVRFNVNLGYIVDNQASLFPFVLDRVERFGQGVYDYDRVLLGLSTDAPLKYVTPFVEWTLQWPNGAQCEAFIEQQCVGEVGFATYPSWVTFGARSEATDGLSFDVGLDLGITTKESQGTPAVPGWNLVFGMAYNLDPRRREVQVPVEVPVAVGVATSYVEGTVREAGTGRPIEGARIRYLETEYTDQITGADGRFRTFDFEPGSEMTIEISHPEYVTRAMRVTISEEVLSGPIDLEPAFSGALVSGRVNVSSPTEITVSFRGPSTTDVVADDGGNYEVELEPGEYRVIVHAPGYTAVRERITFEAGRHTQGWSLGALAPGDAIRVAGDGFVFADAEARIEFDAAGALTPASTALLDQVAAFLAQETRGRVLVRAHTDTKDTIDEELELTSTRARAVVDYLVGAGVPAGRLSADGVGAAEPLFPNVTDRNRRQNNRIEFRLAYE